MPTILEDYIGLPISEIPTPALMIDIDVLENNLARMRDACSAYGKLYRPHAKAHKSSIIAKMQLEYGAHGHCAAKLGEAEVLVSGGLQDILITAPVVGRRKIERLLALNSLASAIKIVADSAINLQEISAMAAAVGAKIKVLIDVNIGQNRTGVDNPEQAVLLAHVIESAAGLEMAGIQAYGGTNQHIVGFERRREMELRSLERAVAARKAVEKAGYDVGILSVGGTGTYNIDTEIPEVTEIQPGSYIFMDAHYRSIGGPDTSRFGDFGNSLSVYTTIISHPVEGRAISDGGNKALSADEGQPIPLGLIGAEYRPGGDEYGILDLKDSNLPLNVGDKLEFIPGHCDTTVNLHDNYYAVRKGMVEAIWRIEARGRMD
jgi:D-serine deaminase-like pyridoxal phosphate-dependent protein